MAKPRLIPVLLLKQGLLVRSQLFSIHQAIGNPMSTVRRLSNWNVDELVLLDISEHDWHDLRRSDLQQSYSGSTALDVLREVAKVCHMPLSFGGRICTIADVEARLNCGADKVVINSQALADPDFVSKAARRFGSQCVVVSIDAKREGEGRWQVYGAHGRVATGRPPAEWAARVEELGAGEIFLNSIDRDGTATGYDLDLIRSVTAATTLPVVACGGVGDVSDFPNAVLEAGAGAAAAANIFHFTELSYAHAKQACLNAGLGMRPNHFDSTYQKREPTYDWVAEDARFDDRLRRARERDFAAAVARPLPRPVTFCTQCLYPSISASPVEFDEIGACMGCRTAKAKEAIPASEWARRTELLREILEESRCRDGSRHDVIVPVSGGKDSYFQVHMIKTVLGFNPLLVTYDGNNYSEVGWRNLLRMKEVFDVDHIIYRPSVRVLQALNRIAFVAMGDMNWHAHIGINTIPVRVAVQHKIPTLIWGEHGYLDLSGQFSLDDYPEMTYRQRLEHFGRGFEWNYFVGREGLTSQDMIPWKYPSDRELFESKIRGLYLGNYVHWEANEHTKLVIDRYGFKVPDTSFERTYRRMSNLDDVHENGIHDYLKYVKFGYGRCTDHTCKDIRAGLMSRGQALDLVETMDPIKSSDLARWLEYVGMNEPEFDAIADTFRDPRVWWRRGDSWVRDTPRHGRATERASDV